MSAARKTPSKRTGDTSKPSWFSWRRVWIHLIGLGLLLGALYYGGWLVFPGRSESESSPRSAPSSVTNRWGQLEVIPIMIERPLEYFSYDAPPPPRLRWFFERHTPAQLLDLLMTCGLSDHQMTILADTNRWQATPDGIWVEPDLETIRDLEPASRERLYGVLAESLVNPDQRYPACYRGERFEDWFDQCGLAPAQIELIERMTYRRKGVFCFSDMQYLRRVLPPDTRLQVARTLARVPSLLVNLRITPKTDLSAILDYWGTSSRLRQAKPLLESVKRTREGSSINIAWFFPPVPRLWLYTYPNPTNSWIGGKLPDCFFSSMNFFNEAPDPRLIESEFQTRVLKAEYHIIPRAERFGDIILLYEPDGLDIKTVHMCVFIADDIVFTKNGYDIRHPWVLMRLEDMMIHYSPEKPLSKMCLRRNKR